MGEFPSREHQFGPGNNANPRGRPKGKSVSRILRELGEVATRTPASLSSVSDLVDTLMAAEGEEGWALTVNQALALRLIAIGLYEEHPGQARQALRHIQDRTEGRVKQTVDLSVREAPPVDLSKLGPDGLRHLRDLAKRLAEGRPEGGPEGS